MPVHPTSIIDSAAEIADDAEIGPYTIINGPVKIGSGCRIASHVHLYGDVTIGEENRIDAGAVIGADPQSINFDPETPSRVEIGRKNVIREYATIHRSEVEGGVTRVGDENFLMTGAHLGHDVEIGNHVVIANNCLLGGHVKMGNHVFLGGGSVYHQFCRVGDHVMAQGLAGISKDIPPFIMIAGVNRVAGLNIIGLRRGGFDREARSSVKKAFELIYRQGLSLPGILEEAEKTEWNPAASAIFDFLRSKSKHGFCLKTNRDGRDRSRNY